MRIRKREWRRGVRNYAGRAAAVLAAAAVLVWCDPVVSRAEATGTVLPNSVNIRKTPDQGSEVIGSSTAGKEINIRGQVEVSGTTWYQVYIDANTLGYVRADMIEKTGDEDIPEVTVSAEENGATDGAENAEDGEDTSDGAADVPTGAGVGAEVEAQEAMSFQYATTSTKTNVKVRPDPSTAKNHVDSLTPGTQVVVSGKSEGSDGHTWYYVNYTGSSGSERTGYIRSDLLDLGDLLQVEEEAPSEPEQEETPQETVKNDYELRIETNSEGEETWYLYDNIKGNKEPLQQLLESASSQSVDDVDEAGAIVKQRIVIVVLAVLLVALAVTVIIMAFKLRDSYYEDDDEDEEDDRSVAKRRAQREKEREARRRAAEEEDVKERAAARRREGAGSPRTERQERQERQERPAKREREGNRREEPETVKPAAPRRKTKNFLLEDDEFEFEFLSMDDKDLK